MIKCECDGCYNMMNEQQVYCETCYDKLEDKNKDLQDENDKLTDKVYDLEMKLKNMIREKHNATS